MMYDKNRLTLQALFHLMKWNSCIGLNVICKQKIAYNRFIHFEKENNQRQVLRRMQWMMSGTDKIHLLRLHVYMFIVFISHLS